MRKTFFFAVILFFVITVFGKREARAEFTWNFCSMGAGTIYSDFDFNLKALNFFFQPEFYSTDIVFKSPFGVEIVPITYDYSKFYGGNIVSFMSAKLYLNLMPEQYHSYKGGPNVYDIIGPFVSVRALNNFPFRSDNYIIDAGLKFTATTDMLTLVDIEIGSKYFRKTREQTIFINASVSILIPFVFFAL